MQIRSTQLEGFLRREIDSSIRVQNVFGLDLGPKGVAFQYQSLAQTVWIVFEYTTAASLILAPLYAPLSDVEAIVTRETFEDSQLDKLGELHRKFLDWLKEHVDDSLEPTDGRFFSTAEPMPEIMAHHLKSVEPFAANIALMGYPKGAMHIFVGLPPERGDTFEQIEQVSLFQPEPKEEPDHEEVGGASPAMSKSLDWALRGALGVAVFGLLWLGWDAIQAQHDVVQVLQVGVKENSQVRVHQVRIPAGRFIMGCTLDACDEDELPHRVTIGHELFMTESEITQEQYHALMGNNPSYHYQCGVDCPVDSVTWEQAVTYANRLSLNHGYQPCYTQQQHWEWDKTCTGWRLPTEAEWEWAALGVRTDKAVDDNAVKEVPLAKTAWYVDQEVMSQLPIITEDAPLKQQELLRLFVESHPVCSKTRNGYGLCDMSGNVWEWVWDWYQSDVGIENHNTTNPSGPDLGRSKVLKGGAFNSPMSDIYPHRRIHLAPWATMGEVRFESTKDSIQVQKGSVGFRLVRTVPFEE